MSSSFPSARFPALSLANEKEAAEPLYKDKSVPAEEPPDEALIARICDADEEALALLFRRYTRVVWSIAERILRDKAEADDVVQEVFLRV
jgi:sigma-70-like protein